MDPNFRRPEATETIDLEIRCPIETRVLGILRTFVTSLAGQIGFSEEETDQIEMAVDEACANVIRHAYKHLGISPDLDAGEQAKPPSLDADEAERCVMKMRISLGQTMLRFQIIDYGIGMNRKPAGVTDVEEYLAREGKGGLGTLIIRNFMDEVEYQFPPGKGTVLTMTKYLKTAESR